MDNIVLAPIKTQKAYCVIVETLINLIATGQLEYGHRLYNEAELMKILNVSRSTLREALRVMEFIGIVTVSPRKGIHINSPSETDGYPPLIYMLLFQKIKNVELFEVRRALQVEMAGVAAEHRTKENLAALRDINQGMIENKLADYTAFAQFDYDFHLQIVRCAENRLSLKLMETLGVMLKAQMCVAVQNFPTERRQIIIDYHTKILTAIEDADVGMAKHWMTEHLEKPYHSVKNANMTYCLGTATNGTVRMQSEE